MVCLYDDTQGDILSALNTTSRYLDDILNINNIYFDNMFSKLYPPWLKHRKTNTADTTAAFLFVH